MPGYLFHVGASANCPHGGMISAVPSCTRVLVSGQPVVTVADTYPVAGCPFTLPPGTPQPCISVRWLTPATRVMVNGQFVILQASTGLCLSAQQAPQGPPIVTTTQVRVSGI